MFTTSLATCRFAVLPELVDNKMYNVYFDNTRIKAIAPEFVCTTGLATGVTLALDWFDVHPKQKLRDDDWENLCDRLVASHETGLAAFNA